MDDATRRRFLKTAGATGVVLAAGPGVARGQGGGEVTLALVGCAHIHVPGFAKQLAARPDVRVKWAWDPDPARVEKWGGAVGARPASSYGEILADPEVRGVVILSETTRHRELVAAAARARKHLFVEKPLGVTGAESRAMADAIERAGLLFTTGYFMRTDPKILFLREQLAKGAFGRVTRASAWNCHGGSLGGWFDEKPGNVAETWRWMADPKVAGVGAFGDLGTHSLDVLMWLLGPVHSVSGEVRVVTGRHGDCDETGTAMLRLKDGPKHPLQQWVDAVAGAGGQPLVAPREAADRVAVMEAAYESARSGRWVDVSA